jgi:hypothetical protein
MQGCGEVHDDLIPRANSMTGQPAAEAFFFAISRGALVNGQI